MVSASITVRHVVKGFAVEPWMYYLGAMVDIIGPYAMSIVRSMMSCCVAPNELGKVYALLSAFDSLVPIGVAQGYSILFKVRLLIHTVMLKSISFYACLNSNTCHFPPNIFSWSKGGDEGLSLPLNISVYLEKMLGGKWHVFEFHRV